MRRRFDGHSMVSSLNAAEGGCGVVRPRLLAVVVGTGHTANENRPAHQQPEHLPRVTEAGSMVTDFESLGRLFPTVLVKNGNF